MFRLYYNQPSLDKLVKNHKIDDELKSQLKNIIYEKSNRQHTRKAFKPEKNSLSKFVDQSNQFSMTTKESRKKKIEKSKI